MTTELPRAVGAPLDAPVRPACWAFAMDFLDFLGEPEYAEVEAYATSLETEIQRLRAEVERLTRLTVCACGTVFEPLFPGQCSDCARMYGADF